MSASNATGFILARPGGGVRLLADTNLKKTAAFFFKTRLLKLLPPVPGIFPSRQRKEIRRTT
jgi:hypothetical protein